MCKTNHAIQKYGHSVNGFTLIETLITLLIMSIGLLGLAGLQTKGLQLNHVSYMRSQAIMLSNDIVNRMRTNNGEARKSVTASTGYDIAHGAAITSPPDCNGADCTTAELATFDLAEWKKSLAKALPAGDGEVSAVVGTAPVVDVTVTVRWSENKDCAAGTACPGVDGTDLKCYQINVSL